MTERRRSLRRRLTVLTVSVALGVQLVLGAAVFAQQWWSLDEVFSTRLENRAEMIVASIMGAEAGASLNGELFQQLVSGQLIASQGDEFAAAVYGDDGRMLAASRGVGVGVLAPDAEMLELDSGSVRVGRRELSGVFLGADETGRVLQQVLPASMRPSRVLVIATTDTYFEQSMAMIRRVLYLAMLVGTVSAGAAGWVMSGFALRPLRELAGLATSFRPEQIREQRHIGAMPSELEEFRSQLDLARERLRDAFHAQDRLISNVCHEMKTPIAVLLAEAETVDTSAMSEDAQQLVRSVRQEMKRLGGTIETFVLLARVRSGATPAPTSACALNDVLLEAVVEGNPLATRRGVRIRLDAAADLQSPMVRGDPELLGTMFGNVLRCCVRSSRPGDEVEVSAQTENGRCVVQMRDRGPAVPREVIGTLFDRFVAEEVEDSTMRRELGLPIAQGIAELHGGQISAANTDGGGCTFTIRLPLADVLEAAHRDGEASGSEL